MLGLVNFTFTAFLSIIYLVSHVTPDKMVTLKYGHVARWSRDKIVT